MEACVAIGKYLNFQSVPTLIRILENPYEVYEIQVGALHSLKKINFQRSFPELKEISTNHKNIYLRAQIQDLFFKEETNESVQ